MCDSSHVVYCFPAGSLLRSGPKLTVRFPNITPDGHDVVFALPCAIDLGTKEQSPLAAWDKCCSLATPCCLNESGMQMFLVVVQGYPELYSSEVMGVWRSKVTHARVQPHPTEFVN